MNVEKSKLDDCMNTMEIAQDLLDEAIERMNEVLEDVEEAGNVPPNIRTIKIHDLRKDPADLPKNSDTKRYLVWGDCGWNMVLPYYNGFNCLSNYWSAEITSVIAWLEIPKL